MKLADIHRNYDTDKGTSHSYIEIYDLLFERYQNQKINFLEIGCLTCGSIKMFNEFFTQGHIYGMDNWEQNTDHMGHLLHNKGINLTQIIDDVNQNYPRVKLITCDSTNLEDVDEKFKDKTTFDVIIDDGDHRVESQYATFTNMINYLNKDGYYVIEDVEFHGVLMQRIQDSHPNLQLKFIPLYKNHRPDDALIIITKD